MLPTIGFTKKHLSEENLLEMDRGCHWHARGVRSLHFEDAENINAWVINLGAHNMTYTGHIRTVEGTMTTGPQRVHRKMEIIEVSLPPMWFLLQHLVDHGKLEAQPLAEAAPAPASPPEEMIIDPEEFVKDVLEYIPLDDDDD